jgi:ectoine hydroxylase-related dioxygenase (phytanoyl-CoA dioxygenase family)
MTQAAFFDLDAGALDDFARLTAQSLDPGAAGFADEVVRNVPIYDVAAIRPLLAEPLRRRALCGEWAWILGQSAGVLVLRGAVTDHAALDAASEIYRQVIAAEKAGSAGRGDHFAVAGANDRVWNALQKLCEADPEVFARYFGNEAIAAVCEAWLGPAYQMTAQVNLVHPGGKAQEAHRDYHLGFQSAEAAARFPAHAHELSAVLTLQGAVAHCDMPVESGPTKLLPFSQLFRPGYMAYRREPFRAHFEAHCIQLPLARGDALFFNPALFHAAGENRSAGIERLANLLQVSSAFGRAMESVDREAMCRRLYPVIAGLLAEGRLAPAAADAAIAAAAEGYAFPTNLDSDPPLGGMAPESQAALFRRALAEGLAPADFEAALAAQSARRRA